MSNSSAEVLALVGSLEYSSRDQGFNNGATALRSPGSTLKPFLYALALDSGFTAAGTLEDMGRKYRFPHGEYLPQNFNRESYGPVSLREALGNSLNLSAVNLLNRIGYGTFYQSLAEISLINYPDKGPDYYGLGMVVGNPEVSLVQLVSGYASLANRGFHRPAKFILEEGETEGRRIFSPQAAYIISRILSDPAARSIAFAGSLAMNSLPGTALKTGTSTRYRDCWTLGYTPEYTVGVWVGNFEGQPTWNMTGTSAAAPIFADIIRKLYPLGDPPLFEAPENVLTAGVCSYSGMKPTERCPHVKEEIFIRGTEPAEPCTFHRMDRNVHELPTRYAGWLHDRYLRGTEGKYRLAGFGHDLGLVFDDPIAGPETVAVGEVINEKVTIGKEPADPPSYPGHRVSIIYPLDGDHYLMERGEMEQMVALKAVCEGPAREISWYVNGVEYASTGPPYELQGRLTRGRHLISAVGPSSTGDSVEVLIE
jgi:penicillin-binding protein 1C